MTSLAMVVVKALLRTQRKAAANPEEYRRSRLSRSYPVPAPTPDTLQLSAYIQHERQGEAEVFTLQPREQGSGWHILYLPGGAYVEAPLSAHWSIVEELMRRTGATVTVAVYPLAPEHTYADAQDFLLEVYQSALQKVSAERLVLMGDSAGGGLALAQTMRLRDLGLPLPARLILFSPWLDVTLTNPTIPATEPEDPMLAAGALRLAGQWWAGRTDPRTPIISPLYGDPRGLPPTHIFQGTADILLPDVRRYVQQARAVGAATDLYEYPGAIHVFPGATYTPEAQDTFAHIARLLGQTRAAPPRQGLAKWLALPPVKILLYLIERQQQNKGRSGQPRSPRTLLVFMGLSTLLYLLRRTQSRN